MLTATDKMMAIELANSVALGCYDFDVLYTYFNSDVEHTKEILEFLRSVAYKYPFIKPALDKLWLDTILVTQDTSEKEVKQNGRFNKSIISGLGCRS